MPLQRKIVAMVGRYATAPQAPQDGCGSVGNLCFEEEGVRLGEWRYQGQGQGAYEKVEDLKYVGQGRGSWDREVLPTGWRCRWTSLCLCFLVLIATALAVAYAMLGGPIWPISFSPSRGHSDLSGPSFDCTVELDHWEAFWTDEKKAYCCGVVGHGCAAEPFDCNAARANWQAAWSEEKKKFCCNFDGGCPHGNGAKEFDCSGSQDDWSADKKEWCCAEHDKGCEADQPYDCRAGVTNWQNGWSDHKKYWCCKRYDVACPNPVVYDCDAGYSTWQKTWSTDKKAWCCGRLHRGCDQPEPFDCEDGFNQWHSQWSLEKQEWCCVHASRACQDEEKDVPVVSHVVQVPVKVPVPAPVPVYVHHIHHVHPVHVVHEEWSTEPAHEMTEYNCWSDSMAWSAWSHAHRHFCCDHHHICGDLGTVTHVAVPAPVTHVTQVYGTGQDYGSYDCSAGIQNWRAGWSDSKKQFCCNHYTLGCEVDDSVTDGDGTVISGDVSGGEVVDGVQDGGVVVDTDHDLLDGTVNGVTGIDDAGVVDGETEVASAAMG